MTDPGEEAPKARALGLALLDASRIYEGFVIPNFEGRLRRRPFPPHRRDYRSCRPPAPISPGR
jgi:hypothetical protein